MNTLKQDLKGTMSAISTGRDVVTSAKIRADAEKDVLFFKKRKHKIGLTAALCAVVVLTCGLTVSAVSMGWVYDIFGDSAAIIEKNPNDYSVKIGNVKVKNAEGLGSKFTLGDVISDGKMLYINIIVDDPEGELCWGTLAQPGLAHLTNKTLIFGGGWETIDKNGSTTSTAVTLKLSENIKKGDVIGLKLTNGSMKHDFLTPEEAKKWRSDLAEISFEIQSEINTARTITVNKTAVFKDRPDPKFAEFVNYDENKIGSKEINIETLTISPFRIEINGTVERSRGSGATMSGWGNMWLVYKNGEKKCVRTNGSVSTFKDGSEHLYAFGNFSDYWFDDKPIGVQDLNEIAAVEFDGFTVPFSSDTETEE